MTSTMMGVPPERQILISCDHVDCDVQHNDTAIAAQGGLLAMGWLATFDNAQRRMVHYCPDHQGANNE